MAITIKKKTLKLKTGGETSAEDTGNQVGDAADDVVIAATMQTSMPTERKREGSFAPFAIMGLIACALLGVLLAIQMIENSFYTGAIPIPGATATR